MKLPFGRSPFGGGGGIDKVPLCKVIMGDERQGSLTLPRLFMLPRKQIGKNKAAGDVGCPSINSSGLYFGNSPVSVSYRLVSNKGSTLLSQIQMFSPLFVHLQNIH